MHLVTLCVAGGGHPGPLVGAEVLDLVAAAPIIPTAKLVPPTFEVSMKEIGTLRNTVGAPR